MACSKVYLVLSAIIVSHVSANYKYERLKVSNRAPWNSQYDIYEGESSITQPCYYDSHETSGARATEHHENLSKRFPSSKKEATEQKNLKKMIVPFYAFANKDSKKYKELLPNSGIAHCEQIKGEESVGKRDASRKDVTICYKCRDPKTKSTYERCLYNSHPEESASSRRVERFAPIGFRYRRSNSEERNYGQVRNPYRFTDEYFTDATYDVPAAYESKGEKCDKVIRDSMVCMVCKDAKTNSKYEQCSYVKQPREKAYSYTKSSSLAKPQQQGNDEERSSDSSKDSDRNQEDRNHGAAESSDSSDYSYPSESYLEKSSSASNQEAAPLEADCKQVEKDSKICTVCKDPKNGGNYEKCVYDYQPSDKLYKYSRSKSFGYPENAKTDKASAKSKDYNYPESSESTYNYSGKSKVPAYPQKSERIVEPQATTDSDNTSRESHEYGSSDYPNHEESSAYQRPSSDDDDDKETYTGEPTSSGNINAEHCKKVQKDSMTCTICKDPKTGNDFEQCSYSYQPSDKLFSYTKSSSFGTPSKTADDNKSQHTHEEPARENEQPSSASYENSRGSSYDKYVPTYEASSTADEAKSVESDAANKRVAGADAGYFDTAKKKAEIEAFMQNFQKEDRSSCKKIMRDKMTCYQCVDKSGFQKEECAFVTGHEPDRQSTQLAFHEVKELQIDPGSRDRVREIADSTRDEETADPVEPSASASGNSYVRLKKSDNEYPDETTSPTEQEETKEAEPYDYTSETRPVYDEVLGMTLPAYMFATSEHEAAFDEVVASSHDQR